MKGRLLLSLLAVVSALVLANAAQDVRGQVQPNAELANVILLGPNTKVLLRAIPADNTTSPSSEASPQYFSQQGQQRDRVTWVAVDGSFVFKDVEEGAYTLEVVSKTHAFNKYRIDVPSSEGKGPQIRVYTPGTSLSSILSSNLILHPLILHAIKRNDFFTEAAPLTLGSLIGMGGPMMILGIVAMGMVFVLPKLTAALDPESQKELAESQARMQKRMAAVQTGDLSSLLYKDDHAQKSQQQESKRAS